MIAHWKGLIEKKNFQLAQVNASNKNMGPKSQKMLFRASKRPQKFGTQKVVEKLPRWKFFFEARKIGGWPPIST
jgi:hypothetical protein